MYIAQVSQLKVELMLETSNTSITINGGENISSFKIYCAIVALLKMIPKPKSYIKYQI